MKKIKVDKVILYYMDRVDPDGNLYRFYVYKDMASEIEYFCTEETGNMTIPIGEGEYVKIVPKKIEKIPVRGYRKLTGIWNRETCNGKGWYRLFNYFKYKPTLCYFKKAGHDENGNTRYEISFSDGRHRRQVGKCEELRFRGDGACFAWRKATVDEIVEHFKNR